MVAASLALSVSAVQGADGVEKAVEKPQTPAVAKAEIEGIGRGLAVAGKAIVAQEEVKPSPVKVFAFKDEPVFFKGSGSCEGIEFSDLNQDGIRDVVSGVPRGNIHVYYGAKGEKGITYGEKQILKNAATAKDIHVKHW